MCLASSCLCSLATAAMANIDRESGSASNRNHSHIFPTLPFSMFLTDDFGPQ
jgi:hypothetical protein